MSRASYIGVSGLTSRAEVDATLAAFPDCGRQLMVGVLASQKSVRGLPVRLHRRYPAPGDIGAIFTCDPRCLNLVHYSSDEYISSVAAWRLVEIAGPHCHGFQFNGAWPHPGVLERLLVARPGLRIVVQSRFVDAPDTLIAQLSVYDGMITDVLLDASCGRGHDLDPGVTRRASDAVRGAMPTMGVGVAGGLCAETIERVADLVQEGASIDAEGRLRDDADGGGSLDLVKVRAYLEASAAAARGEARRL